MNRTGIAASGGSISKSSFLRPRFGTALLVAVAAVSGYWAAHLGNVTEPTVSWAEAPVSDRYERVSEFLDRRLEEAAADHRLWEDGPKSRIAAEIRRRLPELSIEGSVDFGTSTDDVEGGVTMVPLTVSLSDHTGFLTLSATLLLPRKRPAPLILFLHGMGSDVGALLEDQDYHHGIGMTAARAGFAVLIPERLATDYEGRAALALKALAIGTTLEGIELKQLEVLLEGVREHRALDGCLGVYGLSIGGYHAALMAALNPGIDATYLSGFVTDRFGLLFKRYPTPVTPAGDHFARTFWRGDLPMYAWDMGPLMDDRNLIALIAPRPLAIETGMLDRFRLAGLEAVEQGVRAIYAGAGSVESLTIHHHAGGHESDPPFTVSWFRDALGLGDTEAECRGTPAEGSG